MTLVNTKRRLATCSLLNTRLKSIALMMCSPLKAPVMLLLLFLGISLVMNHPTVLCDSKCDCNIQDKEKQPSTQDITIHRSNAQNYDGPQTIWNPWRFNFPCFEAESNWNSVRAQRSPTDRGLLFVREMKTGSSTLAGVLLRIAHGHSRNVTVNRMASNTPCRLRIDHGSARKMEYNRRIKTESFLLSLLRDPTKRAISHFFHFEVSEKKIDPTDNNFQNFFKDNFQTLSNYYIKDLSMTEDDWVVDETELNSNTNDDINLAVDKILRHYNFIAITERLEESLIVMKLLLNLDMEDILYMSAKKHGSFTTGPRTHPCVYIVPSFLTPGMKDFFQSDYWKDYIRADQRLYDAAVHSLDNTIEALGRQRVTEELERFRVARQFAQEKCESRTVYRCNSKGEFSQKNSTCYLWDIGCGHACLDEIAIERDVFGNNQR